MSPTALHYLQKTQPAELKPKARSLTPVEFMSCETHHQGAANPYVRDNCSKHQCSTCCYSPEGTTKGLTRVPAPLWMIFTRSRARSICCDERCICVMSLAALSMPAGHINPLTARVIRRLHARLRLAVTPWFVQLRSASFSTWSPRAECQAWVFFVC